MTSTNDWLPAQTPFEVVRRGYHPEQVTAHLERLEYELRIATANRDATNESLSELTTQLQAAQAEVDTLRAQLDRNALEPVSMAGLSDRMQRMIRLAEEEAAEIRAKSAADADVLRAELEKSLEEAKDSRAAFDVERERTRSQLADQVSLLIGEATAEAAATRSAAEQEAGRQVADATAEAQRLLAAAGIEATRLVGEATTEATRLVGEATTEAERLTTEAERLRTDASAEAERITGDAAAEAERVTVESTALAAALVADARAVAEKTTADAAAAAQRLDAESTARRTGVEEDFEITIQARRTEAYRVLTEREETSTAEAKRLVDEATAEATRLVAEAEASASATVAAAAAEAHHRVSEADAAVLELTDLRGQLRGQLDTLAEHLDHIRDLTGAAGRVTAELPAEPGRQRATDFPADPALRQVRVPEPAEIVRDVEPEPADDEPELRPTTAGRRR